MKVSPLDNRSSVVADSALRLVTEQIDLLVRLSRSALSSGVFVALFVGWLLSRESPWQPVAIWFALIVLITITRGWMQYAFAQGRLVSNSRVKVALLVGIAVHGFIWSLPSTWLLPMQPSHQVVLGVFLVGLSAASLISLGPMRHAYSCFIIAMLMPIAVLYFFKNEDYTNSAIGIVAYVIAMIAAGKRYTKNIEDMLRLQLDNAALATRLQKEKEVIERANEDLQKQILQREQTEAQLRLAKGDAEAANRAKSQFLANMSHELRTPLNGILGLSELLLRSLSQSRPVGGNQPIAKQVKHTQLIHNAGERLLHLINDILDMARVESGTLRLENIVFSPRQLIDDVVDLMDEQYASRGLALTLNIDADVPLEVRGDVHRIRQVLTNLVSNALKFTERGTVTVSLQRVASAVTDITHANMSQLRWSVRDTGIGIAAHARSQLFQPFSQVDDSATRKFGGTGLGLAISHQLVTALGGHIDFTSEPNNGSTFWFELPLEIVGDTTVAHDDATLATQQTLPGHVLIVEDNNTNRLLVMEMLELLGCTVNSAINGIEALEKLRHDRFDVVLMDWHMPEMDGVTATREFRQHEIDTKAVRTPVIALTASVLAGDRETCLQAGMDDFIPKPFTYDELIATVKRWLPARSN